MRQLTGPITDAKWNEMARELFEWQFSQVPAYRRLCEAHGVTPETLATWREIPAAPQQLFKQTMLYAHELKTPEAIYVTSGTSTGQPGRQHLLSNDIYRNVSIAGARRAGLLAKDVEMHFLVPSPREAPFSSLSTMFGFWQKEQRLTGPRFWVRDGHFAFAKLRETLQVQLKARKPIAICGTAFSFVHLIDAWADLPPLKLPRGSWLLETGGFKGRSREVSKAELYAEMARIFGVHDDSIWNEYGMSELSSQGYAHGTNGLHETPPWARVLVCDPASGREVAVGRQGLVRWIDLANTDSVMALQTLDLAERTARGFRLIGRMARTEPRGCSLSAEDIAARQFSATP
jgi:phenylacetate-coenzyme A ligase PaaK-like adenylate-forming protein